MARPGDSVVARLLSRHREGRGHRCQAGAPGFFCAILYKFLGQRASFGVAGLAGQLELAGFQKPGVENLFNCGFYL